MGFPERDQSLIAKTLRRAPAFLPKRFLLSTSQYGGETNDGCSQNIHEQIKTTHDIALLTRATQLCPSYIIRPDGSWRLFNLLSNGSHHAFSKDLAKLFDRQDFTET